MDKLAGILNEEEIQELLIELLSDDLDADEGIESFEDAGMLTHDKGLVLRLGDREFQITIVRSR